MTGCRRYLVLDLFSRFPVAWTISAKENAAVAQHLFSHALSSHAIEPGRLVVHQDRGAPMIAHGYREFLDAFGVRRSYSRPRVSNDNPFSESCFKTIKYSPAYPGHFAGIDEARAWVAGFIADYNNRPHEGLNFHTPAGVLHGRVDALSTPRARRRSTSTTRPIPSAIRTERRRPNVRPRASPSTRTTGWPTPPRLSKTGRASSRRPTRSISRARRMLCKKIISDCQNKVDTFHGLTTAQKKKLHRWIVHKTPQQLRLPFMLWTRAVVQAPIERECGVRLSLPTVGRYLARWGLTPQRPVKRALEQDPAVIRHRLEVTYPQIEARAKAEGAVIYWSDETGLRSDSAFRRGFAPAGKTPVAALPAKRVRAEVISAVSNRGTMRFMIYDGDMNVSVMIRFLQRVIRDADRKVFLVVDNLRVHHARRVRAWVAQHPDAIELLYLPPYAPELNPDEYLNGDLKGRVHRGLPPTERQGLKRAMLSALRRVQCRRDDVRRYFRHPKGRYVAA